MFALWGGAVFLVVPLLRSVEPAWPSNPWLCQAIGVLLTTPLGLRVTTLDSLRASGRTALLRTVGKRLP
jgi:hypothetical protein